MSRRPLVTSVFLLVAVAACRTTAPAPTAPPPPASAPRPTLHTLDATRAADFIRAFDEASDRPRYVVAVSPT